MLKLAKCNDCGAIPHIKFRLNCVNCFNCSIVASSTLCWLGLLWKAMTFTKQLISAVVITVSDKKCVFVSVKDNWKEKQCR